jgi:type IV pilus assembly protein PilE
MKVRSFSGLTLLELLVVVAFIGILLAVAYPSYQQGLGTNQAAQMKAYMLEISTRQQLYFNRHGTYTDNLALLGGITSSELASLYNVRIVVDKEIAVANFLIMALPTPAARDSNLRTLTLNHLGQTSDNWQF